MQSIRTFTTKRGARLVQHGTVLSEVLARPGPTHSVADALAVIIHLLSPGPRVAVLGFAAGGFLAPLRQLGCRHEIEAVDLDQRGFQLFKRIMGNWAGHVKFARADAAEWLATSAGNYDVILDDLSIARDGDVIKPAASWQALPPLMKRKLRSGGLAISNLLRPMKQSWETGLRKVAAHHPTALVVEFEEFENRILIAGDFQLPAWKFSRRLRGELSRLESRQAAKVRVRRMV